jgi:hypothetical protein
MPAVWLIVPPIDLPWPRARARAAAAAAAAGPAHGKSLQPGFWNNYVHKCVFSAAAAPIDLAAACMAC